MNQYKFCGAFVIDYNKKTVKLPNYTNTFLMGGTKDNIGYSIPAALPNISGSFSGVGQAHAGSTATAATLSGAFYRINTTNTPTEGVQIANDGGKRDDYFGFDASLSNEIYGKSDTVQPPAIKTIWCIQHTSTNTPAICMPKVNYKKVKIFRDKMSRSKLFI
jgi:hypothetical protein